MMDGFEKRAEIARNEEDQYFRERDRELLEAKKRAEEAAAERVEMGRILGAGDDAILAELQTLGYTAQTVGLLPLLPLVRVAWAEGFVTGRERKAIIEAARSHGVAEGTPANEMLQRWLDEAPADPFYRSSVRLLGKMVRAGAAGGMAMQEIIAAATKVAATSGGFFGFGASISDVEKAVLGRIQAALESEPLE